MGRCAMGSLLLMLVLLLLTGVQSLRPQKPPTSSEERSWIVPWQDELCCDSPEEDDAVAADWSNESGLLQFTQCNFRSQSHHHHQQQQQFSGAALCADVLCRIRDDWTALTCELESDHLASNTTPAAFSFQTVLSDAERISSSDDRVTCEGNISLKCSLDLGPASTDVTINISIAHVTASPVHLKVPPTPVKPSPPVNMSHHQTINAELVLNWENPLETLQPLRHEVRYSSDTTSNVVPVLGEPRLLLDLEGSVNYSVQVRCSSLVEPPLWSDWSEPHHIHLDSVSYLPEVVKVRPGEAVSVSCVFNDHNLNASSAQWLLNYREQLDPSRFRTLNQWVSQITVRPSESTMYDIVLCSQENPLLYSQIYVEGAAVNISCQTNGDINAMECRWDIKEPTNPSFLSRWSDVSCEEMEQRESAGEELGEPGPVCTNERSCTIRPLMMSCYRLWLSMDSPLGPIDSRRIYVSPIDHVKPHTASHIKAETHSSGVLLVSWKPPPLPVQGVRCRLRFHGPTSVGQPEWKVQPSVRVHQFEVPIPDWCLSYAVQVSCQTTYGAHYWSDWSETIYSVQNSTAPKRGPDFWRALSSQPSGGQNAVTLLFELFEVLQTSGLSYCVDGLLVRHQPLKGSPWEERVGLKSSHRFEWNREVETVTVMSYNQHGLSQDNFNMTLSTQSRYSALCSFHVLLLNSTCAFVSWSVLDRGSVPLYVVLQWSPLSPQETLVHREAPTWIRLHDTDRPVHITGEFFSSEEYDFYLYPVFADGEGQPLHTRALRREPDAYMLLLIISFLSFVLLLTLALTQTQMKKIVWKEVPNPNKCSWARGLDLRKVDTLEHLLRAPESVPAWPLLLPSENISTVVIMDKADLSSLAQPPFVSFTSNTASICSSSSTLNVYPQDFQTQTQHSQELFTEDPSPNPEAEALPSSHPRILDVASDHSAQSSVTYTTVVLSDPKLKRLTDSSGCSSSDEGNFSANNSDISDSSHAALWELDSCRCGDSGADNQRPCSYTSVEELSESSEPEDEEEKREKNLYYLKLNAEESEEEPDEIRDDLLKSLVLSKEDCSYPLLDAEDSNEQSVLLSTSPPCGFSPLYMPQYRTAPVAADSVKMPSDCESV